MQLVKVAIYVAYLKPIYFAMQHKESIPEHLLIVFYATNAATI